MNQYVTQRPRAPVSIHPLRDKNSNTYRFPHPLERFPGYLPRFTYRELYLRNFISKVLEKTDWAIKMNDPEIWKKWIVAAQDAEWAGPDGKQMTHKDDLEPGEYPHIRYRNFVTWVREDIEWAKEELKAIAEYAEEELAGGVAKEQVIMPVIDCVWRADGIVGENLRQRLIGQAKILEDVPEERKDWHPGSNKQVLDLVHPSMYPLRWEHTLSLCGNFFGQRYIEDIDEISEYSSGEGNPNENEDGMSPHFQWLPSEFQVSEDGTSTKITSYINNLSSNRETKEMYPVLEEIFTAFIPLFERVLSNLWDEQHLWRRVNDSKLCDYGDRMKPERYRAYQKAIWDPNAREKDILTYPSIHKDSKAVQPWEWFTESDDEGSGEEKEDDEYDDEEDDVEILDPGLLTGEHWAPPAMTEDGRFSYSLKGKELMVIVKLANIILTPENPLYRGGTWHVEAMMNERIVSTGIYYYDQENITESSLAFRQTSQPFHSADMTRQVVGRVYDMPTRGTSAQILGRVETKCNRLVAFPNIFHHRVSPFELADNTKPGYRKILVFFLCDPNEPDIVTTSGVAPQQQGETALRDAILRRSKDFGKLPEELIQQILGYIPRMSRKDAEEARDQLMAERSLYNRNDTKVTGVHFSLCEH